MPKAAGGPPSIGRRLRRQKATRLPTFGGSSGAARQGDDGIVGGGCGALGRVGRERTGRARGGVAGQQQGVGRLLQPRCAQRLLNNPSPRPSLPPGKNNEFYK
jgi:hypothetical protein